MLIIKKKIFLFLITTLFSGCVERYFLEDYIEPESKIVVEATITDEQETQVILISRSSSVEAPEYIPYSGCNVQVINSFNQTFSFEETSPGYYMCSIEMQFLTEGAEFKLLFTTPEKESYSSTFETILPTPEVEKIYYEIQNIPTSDPDYNINGLQFYLDFLAEEHYGSKYLFTLFETWEFHSEWPKRTFLTDTGFVYSPADYSTFVCYKTVPLSNILTLSTSNLTENTYLKYPLNFVSDHTQRLQHNYSLLIKQQTISEEAYVYWEALKNNNQEEAGLFARQPSTVKGNLYNINNPEEHVLGYFSAASVKSSRIVLGPVKELPFKEVPHCTPLWPENGYPPSPRPLYLVWMQSPKDPEIYGWGYNETECFDCTLLDGKLEKPDFFE